MSNSPLNEILSSGEPLTPSKLLQLIGGWIGLAESTVPPILFSISFAIFRDGLVSVSLAAVTAIGFFAFRLFKRQGVSGALIGMVGVALAAFLALREGGQTLDYFVPGFFTNAAYGLVLFLSILIRRPLLGYVLNFAVGEQSSKIAPQLMKLSYLLTWIWIGFFGLRLGVQLPLYYAGNLELLAASRALLGAPAYAGLLAFTWLLIRPVMKASKSF